MLRSAGGRMPSVGGGNMDIRSIIGNIVNFAKSKTLHAPTAPCDGFVLKMHYRWTFFMFLAGFFTVWYNWYHREIITCVSHFNADTQVRLDYINICLSYPFIEYDDESRRYLLFYRWIHWSFFLLAGIYYIPRKISKNIENPKLKKLIEDLHNNAARYDHVESQVVDHAAKYLIFNIRTHNGIYFKFLFLNVLSLCIDLFTLHFLDFILQGHFLRYGFNAYPFERDPRKFTDYMSTMFPPFASCQLEKSHQLTAARKERLGCHLTFMELYEKIFLFIWLWLIILIFVTSLYIIFAVLMILPCFRKFILRSSKPIHSTQKISANITGVSKTCRVGDIYVLYRVKQHLSAAKFYDLMLKLSNPDLFKSYLPSTKIDYPEEKSKPAGKPMEGVRNRRGQPPSYNDPPVNPEFLERLLNKVEGEQSKPSKGMGGGPLQKAPLLGSKNTSILIE